MATSIRSRYYAPVIRGYPGRPDYDIQPDNDGEQSHYSDWSRPSSRDSIVSGQFSDATQDEWNPSSEEENHSDEPLTDSLGDKYEICPYQSSSSDSDQRHGITTGQRRTTARQNRVQRSNVIVLRRVRHADRETIRRQLRAARERRERRRQLEAHHLMTESDDDEEEEEEEVVESDVTTDHRTSSREDDDDDENGTVNSQPHHSSDPGENGDERSTDSFDCCCYEAHRREGGDTAENDDDGDRPIQRCCYTQTLSERQSDESDDSDDNDESSDESSVDMSLWVSPRSRYPSPPYQRRSPTLSEIERFNTPLTAYTPSSPMVLTPEHRSIGKRMSVSLDATPTSPVAYTGSGSDDETDSDGRQHPPALSPISSANDSDNSMTDDENYFTDDTVPLTHAHRSLECNETMPVSSSDVSRSTTGDSAVLDLNESSDENEARYTDLRSLSATPLTTISLSEGDRSTLANLYTLALEPSSTKDMLNGLSSTFVTMHVTNIETPEPMPGEEVTRPTVTEQTDATATTTAPEVERGERTSPTQSSPPSTNSSPDNIDWSGGRHDEEYDDMENYLAEGNFYEPVHGSTVSSVLRPYLNGEEGEQDSIHSLEDGLSPNSPEREEVTWDMIPTANEILLTTWNQVRHENGGTPAQRNEWHEWRCEGGHYTHSRYPRPAVRRRLDYSATTEDETQPKCADTDQPGNAEADLPPLKLPRFDDFLPQSCGINQDEKRQTEVEVEETANQPALLLPSPAQRAYAASVALIACEEVRLRRLAGFERPPQPTSIEQRVALEFLRQLVEDDLTPTPTEKD